MNAPPCSAVIDVHRRGVVAAIEWMDEQGRRHRRIRTFTAASADIGQLGAWLARHDVACIAVVSLHAHQTLPVAFLQERLFALAQHGPNGGVALPLAAGDARGCATALDFVAAG